MAEDEGDAALAPAPAEEAFLAGMVERLPASRLRLVTLPAPPAPLERVWEAWPAADAVLWESPSGQALAGVGQAVVLEAQGVQRFGALQAELKELGREWESVAAPGLDGEDVQLVGGLAFVPAGAADDPWSGLGDARFLLPRWSYRCDSRGGRLTLALAAGARPRPQVVVQEYRRLKEVLGAVPGAANPPAGVAVTEEPPAEQWERAVERAVQQIRAGALAKVVLARRVVASAPVPLQPPRLLTALGNHEAGQYRFGVRVGGRSLVGASPELLVRRHGQEVASEALAGSVACSEVGQGAPDPVAPLLRDPKQLQEHRLVVEAIAAVLADACAHLEFPPQPELRVLRHLAHLATPFSGRLRAPVPALELAARLHPTPAVGGVPVADALQLIAELEDAPRGWFAGPVGTLSPSGDGELAVALRCALVSGRHAHVWAGAGIVAASVPSAEVEETAAKAAAALAALGLVR
jgi:isochorismate synthase